MKRKLEICCYSVESAIAAEKSGADRIELCDNYSEGGTTPSYASIKYSINQLKIPVNVIVRPRGGDFLYSDIEYETIKQDVLKIKKLNANGIVIGFLTSAGKIDIEKTREIVNLSKPMEVTFHRAFDMCKNQVKALEQLKKIGITRILTAGAKNTVSEGIELLAKLVKKAGNEIIIMPGSGINKNNLKGIIQKTNALEFHSSAKSFEKSKMNYFNKVINMGSVNTLNEFSRIAVDTTEVKKMIEILNEK
ncbi:MAG: copper homeostasis protein CutC [Melioribacteraceae bacterium]|nr:copper homeostasis protein CutC [Melioribacteraceae bacterium]